MYYLSEAISLESHTLRARYQPIGQFRDKIVKSMRKTGEQKNKRTTKQENKRTTTNSISTNPVTQHQQSLTQHVAAKTTARILSKVRFPGETGSQQWPYKHPPDPGKSLLLHKLPREVAQIRATLPGKRETNCDNSWCKSEVFRKNSANTTRLFRVNIMSWLNTHKQSVEN